MFARTENSVETSGYAIDTLARRLAERLAKIGKRRRMKRLLDLDDHMLKDIGVTRSEVEIALGLPLERDAAMELRRMSLERRKLMM